MPVWQLHEIYHKYVDFKSARPPHGPEAADMSLALCGMLAVMRNFLTCAWHILQFAVGGTASYFVLHCTTCSWQQTIIAALICTHTRRSSPITQNALWTLCCSCTTPKHASCTFAFRIVMKRQEMQ